jgi:hypothetical protein
MCVVYFPNRGFINTLRETIKKKTNRLTCFKRGVSGHELGCEPVLCLVHVSVKEAGKRRSERVMADDATYVRMTPLEQQCI